MTSAALLQEASLLALMTRQAGTLFWVACRLCLQSSCILAAVQLQLYPPCMLSCMTTTPTLRSACTPVVCHHSWYRGYFFPRRAPVKHPLCCKGCGTPTSACLVLAGYADKYCALTSQHVEITLIRKWHAMMLVQEAEACAQACAQAMLHVTRQADVHIQMDTCVTY